MNKQQYSKSSLIGRIYFWTKGRWPWQEVNSCNVRRVVLFDFPFKVVFGGWRTIMYLLIFQFYAMFFWEINEEMTLTSVISFAAWVIFVFEVFGVWESIVRPAIQKRINIHMPKVPTPQPILKSKEILRGWWDDFYYKVCKPVEWVD